MGQLLPRRHGNLFKRLSKEQTGGSLSDSREEKEKRYYMTLNCSDQRSQPWLQAVNLCHGGSINRAQISKPIWAFKGVWMELQDNPEGLCAFWCWPQPHLNTQEGDKSEGGQMRLTSGTWETSMVSTPDWLKFTHHLAPPIQLVPCSTKQALLSDVVVLNGPCRSLCFLVLHCSWTSPSSSLWHLLRSNTVL